MSAPDKNDPWAHFAEAFRHFDRGWQSADRGFDAASRMPTGTDPKKEHSLTASTWRSRWKMFRIFNRIAWRILLRGRCTIRL